jgi:hypothetical protein
MQHVNPRQVVAMVTRNCVNLEFSLAVTKHVGKCVRFYFWLGLPWYRQPYDVTAASHEYRDINESQRFEAANMGSRCSQRICP